jgi:NAD(P)-dependent dehydrogenase (short-subunit alcohol dehydrogenase family)
VFALGRDVPKTQAVADAINLEAGDPSRVDVVECDLSSISSVRAAADRILATGVHLSVLLNNAGVRFAKLI